MKSFVLVFTACLFVNGVFAQDKYFTREGHIKFFSSTPVEDIEADNHKVTAIMDEATGKLEFSALMKSFEFEKALMEEHFNENYVESSKYPKATFKGKIEGFDYSKTSASAQEVKVGGTLSMHGVSKEIQEMGTISKKEGKYYLKSSFKVKPEDFEIEIPNTVRDNIAQEMEVTVDVALGILKPKK